MSKPNDKPKDTQKNELNTKKDTNNQNSGTPEEKKGHNIFLRIFAILGLCVIAGMYILSFIAAFSDWENRMGIFMGALACTVFFPIVIHLIKIFSGHT